MDHGLERHDIAVIRGLEFNRQPPFHAFGVEDVKICIRAKLRKHVNLTFIHINKSERFDMFLLLLFQSVLLSLMFYSLLFLGILYQMMRLGIKLYVVSHAQVIFLECC
jgi:hypothetical protein